MSTNNNTPLPAEAPRTPPVPVQRSALPGPQEGGWTSISEFEGQLEPRLPTTSVSAYLHGLRRHWVLATILGVLCASLLGLGVWFGWGPQYTASAYFQIATLQPKVVEPQPERFVQSAFDIYKDTQAQLVKSRSVLTSALRDSEISGLGIIRREENKGHDPVIWLQDKLVVSFPGDAELMEVRLTDNDRKKGEEVAKLVNAVVDAYRDVVVYAERNRRNARLNELDKAYSSTHDQVWSKMQELRKLANTVQTADPEVLKLKQTTALRTFAEIQSQHSQARILLDRARGELKERQALLSNLETVPIPELDVETYVNTHPLVRQLLLELAAQLSARTQNQLSANLGSSSRFVSRSNSEIDAINEQIRQLREDGALKIREKKRSDIQTEIDGLEVQVKVLEEQEQRLAEDVAQQEKELAKLGATSIDLEMTRTEVERLDALRTKIQDERQSTKVELQSEDRVRLVEGASQPTTEAMRGIRIALTVLTAILGLCIPAGCVTWWDTRAGRINSSADVSKGLGLTVLGSLPTIPARAVRQLGSASKRHQAWHLRLTESIDGIAARLLRQAEVEKTRVILISSAGSGEGKTTLASQLAMSLARNGRRTALVDFDLRRPAFDKVLGLPLQPGVSEVLRGQVDPSEVVHQTGTENLYVVTAGRWDRHALTALANGAAGTLFDALRAEYEFVVVDAAPILPVADTRFVSQHVDVVVLSVFRDISRAPKIVAAREILEAFGVPCVEAVVTGPTDTLPDKDLRYEASLPA
jgi:succinoglycan biosynthesis transport protein ExoP